MNAYPPFSADGHQAVWTSWDGEDAEHVDVRWDNEAWTVSGKVSGSDIEYVLRLSPMWHVRQFLLFRDLAQPDLWLGTDGSGRWGEVNGAHRPDLDGAFDVHLSVSPLPFGLTARRLPLEIGQSTELTVARVDVDTLGVIAHRTRIERLGPHRWSIGPATSERAGATPADPTSPDLDLIGLDDVISFDVDEFGLPLDVPGRFRRADDPAVR